MVGPTADPSAEGRFKRTTNPFKLAKGMKNKPLPERKNWFETSPVASKVWRIDDHGIDNIYLVEGDEKALLIDTGTGAADLAGCVKTITKLPVMVVNTHGHADHAGGNFQFIKVYAHPLDIDLIKRISSKAMSTCEAPSLEPIREGDAFDLGNRELEVIDAPGHTKGSIVLLESEHKLIFAGDNNNALVWLFLQESLPLEVYMRTLTKLDQRRGEIDLLLPGHGDALEKSFIGEQIICAQKIISGECRGEKYESFAGSGLLCSYKRAGIAYHPDNIFLKP